MSFPEIEVDQVPEKYTKENFRRLKDFIFRELSLVDFRLFTLEIPAAVTAGRFTHSLGFVPLDVIISSQVGAGRITFDQSKTNSEELFYSATGPVTVRFVAGTFRVGR